MAYDQVFPSDMELLSAFFAGYNDPRAETPKDRNGVVTCFVHKSPALLTCLWQYHLSNVRFPHGAGYIKPVNKVQDRQDDECRDHRDIHVLIAEQFI